VTYSVEISNLTRIFSLKHGTLLRMSRLRKGHTQREIVVALNNVNLKVKKGRIFGIMGPNGAGKSTLIKILATLLKPTSGHVIIEGYDLEDKTSIRKIIGVVLDDQGFYWRLSGYDYLKFFGKVYNIDPVLLDKRILELIKMFNLKTRIHHSINTYSLGMRRKLALARAIIHDPCVLLLDEPTLGLDPVSCNDFWSFIKYLAKNTFKTIILTSHNPYEIENLSDEVVLIKEGKVISVGKPEELKKQLSEETGKKNATMSDIYLSFTRR